MFSNQDYTAIYDPLVADEALRDAVWGSKIGASSSWVVEMISEHDMVSNKYKDHGAALFQEQMHEDVYQLLLNTYLPGMKISRGTELISARNISCFICTETSSVFTHLFLAQKRARFCAKYFLFTNLVFFCFCRWWWCCY